MHTADEQADKPTKTYLTRGKDSKRMYFYSDKMTLYNFYLIKGFYTENLGGQEVSTSIIMRRALELLARNVEAISEAGSPVNEVKDELSLLFRKVQ
ncbi:hypothetical protein [Pseudodesulfovibrio piezophilus]|uniref:Uncharacterized protein n=1 Tax=Pseudodesulfovibrio piezophilus (strain DSM 21447 / JCM 15486 / C1TLV30) TaxID=1322246 RepID=M1WLG0_PSEP2|nr:hypothetical protein [Pseudodesulfovibrio piezophilus]CCH47800.1 protein of unknown function [Pseudodesulfovibrio piezophilus C1TLV30]